MLTYCPDYSGNPDYVRAWRGLAWAVLDRTTGDVIRRSPGTIGCDPLTLEELAEAAETVRTFRPDPFPGSFIRYGHLPQGGRSINHATGEPEKGVSCYGAVWDLTAGAYRRLGGLDGAAIAYLIKGAPIYLITGTAAGTGSDGEPVVQGARIVARLVYDSEKDGYKIVD